MRRSKRSNSTRRNLVFAGSIFLLAGLLAASLNFINLKPVLVLSEKHNPTFDIERRDSQDNAYHAFWKADQALPDMADEARDVIRPLTREFDPQRNFDPALGNFLGIANAPAPGAVTDYLLQCESAVTQMQEAVHKPYYLRLSPPSDLQWWWPEHRDLGVAAVGYGTVLIHAPDTARRGLEVLLDVVRMSRMIWPEEGEVIYARLFEDHAMRVLAIAARKPELAPHLPWLQGELETLGPPFADRRALVEQVWIKLDNTLTYKTDRFRSPGRAMRNMTTLYESRQRSKVWSKHRELLYQLADLPPSRHRALLDEHPETREELGAEGVSIHFSLLQQATFQDFYFYRTLLTVALKRYQYQHGALPSELSALVPEFLPELPADPTNNLPFRYVQEDTGVRVYGVGINETDNNGTDDDMLLLTLE